jgi:hypothetical protein
VVWRGCRGALDKSVKVEMEDLGDFRAWEPRDVSYLVLLEI